MNKGTFIQRLIEVLNRENERRDDGGTLLNIPFMVSSVEQHIGEPKYETFLDEIEDDDIQWSFLERDKDDYWSEGKLFIPTRDGCDGVYYLTFSVDERMCGYCMCKPGDRGYDAKHRCCGNGCDWRAPAFDLVKETTVGRSTYAGKERDYWRYEEAMSARLDAMNIDYARKRREQRTSYIRGEIERLQGELREVEG